MVNVLMIAGGFVLLVCGANWLVDGASALAKRFRVSGMAKKDKKRILPPTSLPAGRNTNPAF